MTDTPDLIERLRDRIRGITWHWDNSECLATEVADHLTALQAEIARLKLLIQPSATPAETRCDHPVSADDLRIVTAALLWLLNHYETGTPEAVSVHSSGQVIDRIEQVLKRYPYPTGADMRRFRELFPAPSEPKVKVIARNRKAKDRG